MNLSKYCSDPDGGMRDPEQGTPGHGGVVSSRRPMKRGWWFLIAVIVIALVLLALILLPLTTAKAPHTAVICIPTTAKENDLRDSLTKYLGADYASSVIKAIPVAGGGAPLRHGAWKIEQGMTALSAAHRLCKEAQTGIRLTFNNERTKRQVAEKIASRLDIDPDTMLAAMNDRSLLREFRTDPDHVVGLFMADTYEFYWNASPADVLRRMYRNYTRFWTPERMSEAEKLHLLPREVMVLASIVDEETNQAQEKGTIGRLYVNRLQHGMKLQADPTVRYALGDFTIRRVGGDMLLNSSPYNTYVHEGLPPGPIRITSAETVDAILSSRPHGYLYMCASEDFSGVHNFAVDYDTHMANARRYQQALDQRGIK